MVESTFSSNNVHEVVDDNNNLYRNIIMEAMWMNRGYASECSIKDEEPNSNEASFLKFWKTLTNLWSTNHSKLSVIANVFTIKLGHGLSEADYTTRKSINTNGNTEGIFSLVNFRGILPTEIFPRYIPRELPWEKKLKQSKKKWWRVIFYPTE